MASPPLGRLTPSTFLDRYWQKRPLLLRGAVAGFTGPLDRRGLFALACRDDVESRLVVRSGRTWNMEHGPFRRRQLGALPPKGWTLLVQGVNLVLPAADELLRRFRFVPYARLDDVMVSYAAPGGGVGPHVDSYDVFLLQGFGRRRWRIGTPSDLELLPNVPVKILRRFRPRREWVLGPGDMLYLPPRYAHDGVAVEACTTWSVGFRAPAARELSTALLDFMHDRFDADGVYADPDLRPTREPARIDGAFAARVSAMVAPISRDRKLVTEFLGTWLTEPKRQVVFSRPENPLSRGRFMQATARHGIRLDLRSQMLYDDRHLFINGEALRWPADSTGSLRALANERGLGPGFPSPTEASIDRLYEWYRHGYLHVDR